MIKNFNEYINENNTNAIEDYMDLYNQHLIDYNINISEPFAKLSKDEQKIVRDKIRDLKKNPIKKELSNATISLIKDHLQMARTVIENGIGSVFLTNKELLGFVNDVTKHLDDVDNLVNKSLGVFGVDMLPKDLGEEYSFLKTALGIKKAYKTTKYTITGQKINKK